MKILLMLLLLFPVQSIEYGKPSELKGLKRVFIDVGLDLKNRGRIVEELEKSKLDFDVLESSEGAEIILQFKSDKDKRIANVRTNRGNSRPTYESINTGAGTVFIAKGEKLRAVMSFEDEEMAFERKPATNFARTFLKAYKKANDLK